MKRLYEYLFVRKDPVLMAMPWRKPLGFAMMVFGAVNLLVGLRILGVL